MAAAATVFAALDRASRIHYYRLIGDRTLVVGTITGPGSWTRVGSVTETPTSVVVAVRSFDYPFLPRSGVGVPIEFVLTLNEPLGERAVVDASDGYVVRKTRCLGPTLCP